MAHDQLPACLPFADCMGSMARSIFRPTNSDSFLATNILTTLYAKHKEQISPLLRSAIEHSQTGAYDMDIKIPTNISMHAIVAQLGTLGIRIDLDTVKTTQRISTNPSEQIEAVVYNLGHKKGIKLTFFEDGGQPFSIDITPQTAGNPADFRTGPHQSSKKAASVSCVAQIGKDRTVEHVGISGNVGDILDGIAREWVPTMVTNPEYTSIEQAVAAALSALRVELTSPAGPLFHNHRIEETSLGMVLTGVLEQLLASRIKPVQQDISAYRQSEIVKEWMVILCMDKKFVAQILRKSGLDVLLGVVDQLRNIKGMSQDAFNTLIANDPDFASACASMMDIQKLLRPTITRAVAIPKDVEGSAQHKLHAAFRRMDIKRADPRKPHVDVPTIFGEGHYTSWVLFLGERPSDLAQVAMEPDQYWNFWKENDPQKGHTLARASIINNYGQAGFHTVFDVCEEHEKAMRLSGYHRKGSSIGKSHPNIMSMWVDMVASARMPSWVAPTRKHLFGKTTEIADAITTYWRFIKHDPFYPQRTAITHVVGSETAVGLPPGGIRLIQYPDNQNTMKGHLMLVLTCPLAVNPDVALQTLKKGAYAHGGQDVLRMDPASAQHRGKLQ